MPTKPQDRTKLYHGLNLRALTAGVNFQPGQAADALDVLPRDDGAIYSHWGWLRRNATALAGDIVGIKTFNYKGKNAGTPGNVREGNYGIADDAALGQFTRRQAIYTGCIVLTTTTFYFWRPDTEVFEVEALPAAPAGVVVDIDPKPTFIVVNDNVYIFGYANRNLRYDPTDRALYVIGWDDLPTAIVGAQMNLGALVGGLIVGAVYQYATAWWNVYTGEVGPMGTIAAITPTAGNTQVDFTAGAFVDYAGDRHYVNAITDEDVGLVLYRTEPNGEAFYFLTTIDPDLSAATFSDTGLATAKSEKALRADIADEPRFNAADLFKGVIYALSWDDGYNRVYYNDWKNTNSYHERWSILGRSTLPTRHGETLTAVSHTENWLFVGSQQRGFLGSITMSESGRLHARWRPLSWTVGPVGPKAICTAGAWVYFLSERGPYRWKEGWPEPQWIGKDLLAMFIDPTSDLCKLSATAKLEAECAYDLDANAVRFIFTCGTSHLLNRHLVYWIHDDIPELPFYAGWFFASPWAQALDYGNAIAPDDPVGVPVDPFERKARMVFGDHLGYVNEYEVYSQRGGLAVGEAATGIAEAASTAALLVTGNLHSVVGDGLIGYRLEVVHVDGTVDVRWIIANTINTITPDHDFSQQPDGGVWYIAGLPSFWRGVPEHFGTPFSHKDIVNYGLKLQAVRPGAGAAELDFSLQAGDFPVTYRKTELVDMAFYHDKTIGNASGRFVQVEFANSRPDEQLVITGYSLWIRSAETRERDA